MRPHVDSPTGRIVTYRPPVVPVTCAVCESDQMAHGCDGCCRA